MNDKKFELQVVISNREGTCLECKGKLGKHCWVILKREQNGSVCLECADLDHLEFLPSGNATLTRRSKKYSRISVPVIHWARARRRFERQGILVEEAAILQAEQECEADADVREMQRERAAVRREQIDVTYVKKFATGLRKAFPKMPKKREKIIAEHACRKYSGRVGRSAAAKDFDEEMLQLATIAHIRHIETEYDELLFKGLERAEARSEVYSQVQEILEKWLG